MVYGIENGVKKAVDEFKLLHNIPEERFHKSSEPAVRPSFPSWFIAKER